MTNSVAAARCAYCDTLTRLWFTGRRWLCRQCWAENLSTDPEADQ